VGAWRGRGAPRRRWSDSGTGGPSLSVPQDAAAGSGHHDPGGNYRHESESQLPVGRAGAGTPLPADKMVLPRPSVLRLPSTGPSHAPLRRGALDHNSDPAQAAPRAPASIASRRRRRREPPHHHTTLHQCMGSPHHPTRRRSQKRKGAGLAGPLRAPPTSFSWCL
jgi:hypothetical protein